MPGRMMSWFIMIGLALGMTGLGLLYFAGGWAATGVGTNHAGTGIGVIGLILTLWGATLLVVTLITAALMRATARRASSAQS